jgi:hypothetical protein
MTDPSYDLPKVWQSLKSYLVPKDPDAQFWWQLTGYQLACMVDAAGYTIEKQYEILLFHYHVVVSSQPGHPTLPDMFLISRSCSGPTPRAGARRRWMS